MGHLHRHVILQRAKERAALEEQGWSCTEARQCVAERHVKVVQVAAHTRRSPSKKGTKHGNKAKAKAAATATARRRAVP